MRNTVFLSYRGENDVHRARVRDLAERLERAGLEVVLDQLAQERMFHGAGPKEGWPRWSKSQAGNAAIKVLIVASADWFRCYEGNELAGTGMGSAAEAGVIRQRLYINAFVNPDIRIITFAPLDPQTLPLTLRPYRYFADPADFSELVRWLTGTALPTSIATAASDWPETAPDFNWPIADRSEERTAFQRLLSRTPPWRILSICGPSESGKSHLTRLLLSNALRFPDLACGRFDFKGTTDLHTEFQAFVQCLDVPQPSADARLIDGLGQVLRSLKRRARPALLIFDTYELAGEAEEWTEKELLPSVTRETWLRVVIAGQRVPRVAGTSWASAASAPLQIGFPAPEDWLAFGQQYHHDLTLDIVRQVHDLCSGKPSILVQLLGPKA